jgi:hypothetical protein
MEQVLQLYGSTSKQAYRGSAFETSNGGVILNLSKENKEARETLGFCVRGQLAWDAWRCMRRWSSRIFRGHFHRMPQPFVLVTNPAQ